MYLNNTYIFEDKKDDRDEFQDEHEKDSAENFQEGLEKRARRVKMLVKVLNLGKKHYLEKKVTKYLQQFLASL